MHTNLLCVNSQIFPNQLLNPMLTPWTPPPPFTPGSTSLTALSELLTNSGAKTRPTFAIRLHAAWPVARICGRKNKRHRVFKGVAGLKPYEDLWSLYSSQIQSSKVYYSNKPMDTALTLDTENCWVFWVCPKNSLPGTNIQERLLPNHLTPQPAWTGNASGVWSQEPQPAEKMVQRATITSAKHGDFPWPFWGHPSPSSTEAPRVPQLGMEADLES